MHLQKRLFFYTLLYASIALFATNSLAKEQALPAACTKECVTPYGEVLGVGAGNVPAYSNCSANCVVFSPNKVNGTYTGIQWQCVEYARRWLLLNKGVVYGDVDVAADIWGLDYVTQVKDDTKFKMMTFPNGNATGPIAGDLLIYAKAYLKTGHVAVISKVDPISQTVQVIEENFTNAKWENDYARSIPYVVQDNKIWLLDSYLIGWKSVTEEKVE